MRMWLGKEKKYARFSLRTRNRDTVTDKAKNYYHELMAQQLAGKTYFSKTTKQGVEEYLKQRRHYKRNRAIILLTHYAMLRVREVAALRYCDVVDADGEIKAETTLSAEQTKGNKARKVWFAEEIRVELAAYVAAHKPK
jgi:integrase